MINKAQTLRTAASVAAILLGMVLTAGAQMPGFPGDLVDRGGSPYGAESAGEAIFQYDPETRSLIVIADDDTSEQIRRVVEQLDRPTPQVLINVVFAEIRHTDDMDLGLQASAQWSRDAAAGTFREIASDFGLNAATQGAFFSILEDDWAMTLRAYAEASKLEILSRPSILARNNQEAVITVGQEVPFIRDSRITTDGQTINTIQYEDIGIILRVTPYITPSGLVEMYVLPEISTLTGERIQISETVQAPVFAKRSAETRVVVPDGRTVAIGGLMEDRFTESVRKVPILGDIPLLGALFRRKITEKEKTELLIFLTPNVVPYTELLTPMTMDERGRRPLFDRVFPEHQVDRYLSPAESGN